MFQSRVIRMGLLVLFIGLGVWGVLVLPDLQSGLYAGGGNQAGSGVAPHYDRPPVVNQPIPVALNSQIGSAGGQAGDGPAPGGSPMGPSGFEDAATPVPGSGLGSSLGGGMGGRGMSAGSSGYPQMGSGPGMMGMGMSGMMMGGPPGMSGMGPVTEEFVLGQQARQLLTQYSKADRAETRESLKSELRAVLHRQFRIQHERRDAELQTIARRLDDLRQRLKRRGEAQSSIVDRRLELLVSEVDGLGWNADEVPDNLFNDLGSGAAPGIPGVGIPGVGMPGMGSTSMGAPSRGAFPGEISLPAVPTGGPEAGSAPAFPPGGAGLPSGVPAPATGGGIPPIPGAEETPPVTLPPVQPPADPASPKLPATPENLEPPVSAPVDTVPPAVEGSSSPESGDQLPLPGTDPVRTEGPPPQQSAS